MGVLVQFEGVPNKLVIIREPNGEPDQLYGPWLHSDYVGTCFTPIIGKKEWKVEETCNSATGKTTGKEAPFRQPENQSVLNSGDPTYDLDITKITFYFGKGNNHQKLMMMSDGESTKQKWHLPTFKLELRYSSEKEKGFKPKWPLPTLQNLAEPEAGPAMQACLNQ